MHGALVSAASPKFLRTGVSVATELGQERPLVAIHVIEFRSLGQEFLLQSRVPRVLTFSAQVEEKLSLG